MRFARFPQPRFRGHLFAILSAAIALPLAAQSQSPLFGNCYGGTLKASNNVLNTVTDGGACKEFHF